jgi:transposase
MAHIRRKFVDVFTAQGSAIAEETIKRIAQLYGVEKEVGANHQKPALPCGRPRPNPSSMIWRCGFRLNFPKYPANRLWQRPFDMPWTACPKTRPYLDNGFLELDNNTAERAMKLVAIGRKNWMFAGWKRGGNSMAIAFALIETAKLNKVDPQAWLMDVLSRIADHEINKLDELMPWNYSPEV